MKDKRRRPKHYDRPGKRPGFKPDAGGVTDQRAREAAAQELQEHGHYLHPGLAIERSDFQ